MHCVLQQQQGLMEESPAGDVNKGQQSPGLQSLPAGLLDAVLRLLDASSRLQLFKTSNAALAASFPSLTSLTLGGMISIGQLAKAINYHLLLPQLLHLDLKRADLTHEGQLGRSPFIGSRVQELSLYGWVKVNEITSLEVYGFSGLTSSRASADCSWRQLEVRVLDWVTAAYLPLHSLTYPLRLHKLVKGIKEPSIEVLAAAELNLCERNKAGLVLDEDEDLCLSKATVDLLTEQYLSHSRRTAEQPTQPTVASSSTPQ
ncbi:hypothetical protein HaLaN_16143 [Haematococcus lacustris]|uniref:Uncharacterized protein n=1 Tax=Haematococcus lacustris TaxID=44745 RepID=A0A699ZI85_HAELA|nr:hypothetical protein HaLaN_16143 [Haematococcus lacustris]